MLARMSASRPTLPAAAEPAAAIDPLLFRRAMGRFATGVTVVSYLREGEPAGMTVNGFLSVSLQPPLVLVSIRETSRFAGDVVLGDRLGINVLCEQQRRLGPHFANQRDPGAEVRFVDHAGVPVLDGSLAQIVARVVEVHPAGDHLLYFAEVEWLGLGDDTHPLIFFARRYKQIEARNAMLEPDAIDVWR